MSLPMTLSDPKHPKLHFSYAAGAGRLSASWPSPSWSMAWCGPHFNGPMLMFVVE